MYFLIFYKNNLRIETFIQQSIYYMLEIARIQNPYLSAMLENKIVIFNFFNVNIRNCYKIVDIKVKLC